MPDLHSLPKGSRPENAVRNNGPDQLVLERYKLRELAEGWPMYRYVLTFADVWLQVQPQTYGKHQQGCLRVGKL